MLEIFRIINLLEILRPLELACVATSGLSLLVAAVVLHRRAAWQRRALSHVRRDAAGNIYARDPQTGVWHRLAINYLTGTVGPVRKDERISPRQKRRLVRGARRAMRST
jgi:hypothetical protein